jgi:anti-sigma B factor antagonist
MTIERDDRDGCLVLVVHGEVDLSTGGRLMEAGSAALQESAHQPVIRPIRTMGLDEVLSLFRTVDEAVAA